jgi:hypothetical protein
LVLAWLLYAFISYFPHASVSLLGQAGVDLAFWLERLGVIDTALVLWLVAVAASLGARVLSRLGFGFRDQADRIFWGAAVGFSAFSLGMLVLGVSGFYHRWLACLLMAILTGFLLWAKRHDRRRKPVPAEPAPLSKPSGALAFLVAAYLAAALSLVWVSAISPETDWDPLLVDLFAPQRYIQSHGIVPLPEVPQTFFPRHVTMLFTLGMLLNGEITAKLVHFMFGLLCLLGAYLVAKCLFDYKAGFLATCILVASPLFVWEMRTAHVELGLTLFLFASVAVFLVDIGPSGFRRALRAASLMALIGAAGLLPWAVVNGLQRGQGETIRSTLERTIRAYGYSGQPCDLGYGQSFLLADSLNLMPEERIECLKIHSLRTVDL